MHLRLLALLCATAQQSDYRHAGVRRPLSINFRQPYISKTADHREERTEIRASGVIT